MKLSLPQINPGDRDLRGHGAMMFTNLIFGLNTPLAKTILGPGALTSNVLTLYRIVGATVLFWVASLFTRRERVTPKDLLLLFFASLFGIQINQVSFIAGLSMTSPIDASVIVTMGPILTMVLAALHLREPITWKKAGGVLIGASGALLLILSSRTDGQAERNMIGNLLCLLSSLSFAFYLTFFKRLIGRYSPVTLMKWMFLFAAICCTPFGYGEMRTVDYGALPADIILRTLYVVVAATFLAYLIIPFGQKRLRPTVVSMYNYVQPVISSLVAVILGLDVFGWVKTGAALLVFLGVYVVTTSKSRAQLDAEKSASDPHRQEETEINQ